MGSYRFRNWSGFVQAEAAGLSEPANLDGIIRAVKECSTAGGNLRVMGSGHSFTELVPTPGTILSLNNYQGLEEVDVEKREAWVRGGTKLWALNNLLDEQGLMMENLGDINRQSIAGACGTGTHGTGIRWRNIASQSCAMKLVTASGGLIECSEETDRELFKAAQVSLGALGVIAQVRLRLMPSYVLRYEKKKVSFETCAQKAVEYRENNRHFEFYWFPYTEVVQLKFLNETGEPEDKRGIGKFLNDVVLENAAFGLLCRISRMFPSFCKTSCGICGALMGEGVEVYRGHKVFSTTRMVRFNEMEYGVPADDGIATLREIKKWITAKNIEVCFPIEFRYVKGDDIYLSPSYQRDTAYISVHMYRGMEHRKYFDGIESIFRSFGGRPHWGKMHTLTAEQLAPLYPMWEKFQEIRRRLDPKGLFMTSYLKRLFEG